MKPSQLSRSKGMLLKQVAVNIEKTEQMLIVWHKKNVVFFERIISGSANIIAGKVFISTIIGDLEDTVKKAGFKDVEAFAVFCNRPMSLIKKDFEQSKPMMLALLNADKCDDDITSDELVYFFNNAKTTTEIACLLSDILIIGNDSELSAWKLKNIIKSFCKKD